jgi:hypothetical protein
LRLNTLSEQNFDTEPLTLHWRITVLVYVKGTFINVHQLQFGVKGFIYTHIMNDPEYAITRNGVKTAHISSTTTPGFCPGCGYPLECRKYGRKPLIYDKDTGEKLEESIDTRITYYHCPNLLTYPFILEDDSFDWSKFEEITEKMRKARNAHWDHESFWVNIVMTLIVLSVVTGIAFVVYKLASA